MVIVCTNLVQCFDSQSFICFKLHFIAAVGNGISGAGSLDSLPCVASPPGPESLPPLPGLPGLSSGPPSLPTLPLLPTVAPMMVPPMFGAGAMMPMEMRQPPLGRMSPGPRDVGNRSYESRSPSPEYDRYRHRDSSPTSRSERYVNGGGRYYRDSRERSPDRYSSRSERSDRGERGDMYRENDRQLGARNGKDFILWFIESLKSI